MRPSYRANARHQGSKISPTRIKPRKDRLTTIRASLGDLATCLLSIFAMSPRGAGPHSSYLVHSGPFLAWQEAWRGTNRPKNGIFFALEGTQVQSALPRKAP